MHVNYARARSLAFVRSALHLLPLSSSERGLSPIHRFFCRPSISLPPQHSLYLSFYSYLSHSPVRSRANIIRRSGFLRAIKIISINRRLSDTAKTRWPPTGCSSEREARNADKRRGELLYFAGLRVIRLVQESASSLEFPPYPIPRLLFIIEILIEKISSSERYKEIPAVKSANSRH